MKFPVSALWMATLSSGMIFGAALAQQSPSDPVFLQKSLEVVTAQRNNAQSGEAAALARWAMQAEEVERLKAEIDRLRKLAAADPQK